MSMEDDINFGNEVSAEFRKVINEAFAWIFIEASSQSGNEFSAYMPKENRYLKESEYYYRKPFDFFHITTIEKLLSIVNGESIRLYNLHSSKDPDEFDYGADILGLNEGEKAWGKKNVFTFSFCPTTELKHKNIWNAYSNNFQNVAIVFEIVNDIDLWENYHISKVYYDLPSHFEVYRTGKEEFKIKYPEIDSYISLNPIIPFHKKSKFSFEREVRLVGNYPFKIAGNLFKYAKPDFRIEEGRNRIAEYIELPLWKDIIQWRKNVEDENLITKKEYDSKILKQHLQ